MSRFSTQLPSATDGDLSPGAATAQLHRVQADQLESAAKVKTLRRTSLTQHGPLEAREPSGGRALERQIPPWFPAGMRSNAFYDRCATEHRRPGEPE